MTHTHKQCKLLIHSQNLLLLFLKFGCVHGCAFVSGKAPARTSESVCWVGWWVAGGGLFWGFFCFFYKLTTVSGWHMGQLDQTPLWVFVEQRQKEWRARGNNKTHWKDRRNERNKGETMVSWYLVAWIRLRFNGDKKKKKDRQGGGETEWMPAGMRLKGFFSAFPQPSAWLAFSGAKESFSSKWEPLEKKY